MKPAERRQLWEEIEEEKRPSRIQKQQTAEDDVTIRAHGSHGAEDRRGDLGRQGRVGDHSFVRALLFRIV